VAIVRRRGIIDVAGLLVAPETNDPLKEARTLQRSAFDPLFKVEYRTDQTMPGKFPSGVTMTFFVVVSRSTSCVTALRHPLTIVEVGGQLVWPRRLHHTLSGPLRNSLPARLAAARGMPNSA
jgi:hypothetical protein